MNGIDKIVYTNGNAAPSRAKVVVVGGLKGNSVSMDRYSALLVRSYNAIGIKTQLVRPINFLSKFLPPGKLRKYVGYCELLILFPFHLMLRSIGKVVHFADHSDALLMPWALFASKKLVTCHDLIAVQCSLGEIPEHQLKRLGTLYQTLVHRGLSSADYIAAVSESTASDVARLVPGPKLSILLNPLDNDFDIPTSSNVSESDYFLIVSHSSWRKGRDSSIKLWLDLLTLEPYRDSKLIVVGPVLTDAEKSMLTPEKNSKIVVRTGISDFELTRLYAGCIALIHLSKYEGFGWPIIEVNAQSKPAICSDLRVFREIGEHNVFVSETKSLQAIHSAVDKFPGTEVSVTVRERFSEENFQHQLSELLSRSVTEGSNLLTGKSPKS